MSLPLNIYESIPDKMKDGFVLLEIANDKAGTPRDFWVRDVNKSFEKIMGFKKAEVADKMVRDLLIGDRQPHFFKMLEYAKNRGKTKDLNFEFYSKRRKRWIEVTAKSFNSDYIFVFMRDITQNKKLSRLTKESRQQKEAHKRLLTVLDSIEAIVYVSDIDTYEILFLNRYGRKIHGNLKGDKCYEKLQSGQKEPCSFCTNDKLLKKDGTPAGIFKWEHKIERSDRWFECRDRAIRWIDSRLVRLEIATEITDRKKTEEALNYQLGFEKMVADISSSFISGPDTLSQFIDHALEVTGEFFNVDRSYIFQYSPDGKAMTNTYEWCAPGIPPQIDRSQNLPVDALPWWNNEIRKKGYIYIPDVDKLPRKAGKEKEEFTSQNIKSIMAVPIKNKGITTGFFGFDSVKEKKKWTEDKLHLLRIVSELISNAFNKQIVEEALRENSLRNKELSAMLESLFDAIPDVIGIQDKEHRIIRYNRAGYEFLGKTPEEVEGQKCYRLIGLDKPCEPCASSEVYRTKQPAKMEKYMESRGIWLDVRTYPILDENGEILRVIEHIRDITRRKEYEGQLKYLSLHDNLTGLFNRAFFENELNRLEKSREYPVTILSTDMDGLKLINDTISHSKGDELLKNCADVIKGALRKSDILARVGGDEFVAILQRTDAKIGEKVVKRIRDHIQKYNNDNPGLPISVSIGMATAENEDKTLIKIFKEADDSMYKDKLHKGASARSQIIDALLVALGERDFVTQGHVERLTEICEKMGKEIGLSSRQVNDIILLARVHDLGKVGIPDSILFKEGPLTAEEWEVMRLHSEKGYRISLASPDLSSVADLTLKHHENWDGSGYPLGLKEKEIPIECRILAIADAFDAMTNQRPYRRTMSEEEAIAELKKCAGKQFDPELVEIFLTLI